MAGRDQSANLTGMLTDIGATVGSMGDAYKPVLQAATKPKGDMNDPEHLAALAQWATQNGDATAASMYMTQARDARAEGKVEAERLRVETKAKAANAATLQYKTALESGVAGDIAKAENALIANAAAHGYNALDRMSGARAYVKEGEDKAYNDAEKARVGKERAFTEQFSAQMNTATDPEAIQKAVTDAPPEMQPAAQRAATLRLQFLEGVSAREAREAENLQIVDADITIPESMPDKLKEQYTAEVERLQADIVKGMNADGKTWEPTVRRGLQNRRDRLAEKIGDVLVRDVLNQETEARAEVRRWEKQWQDASLDTPDPEQAEAIRTKLKDDPKVVGKGEDEGWWWAEKPSITDEQVIEQYRNELREALEPFRPSGVKDEAATTTDASNRKKFPKAPDIGTVKNNMRYKGGNPASETSWEDVKPNE